MPNRAGSLRRLQAAREQPPATDVTQYDRPGESSPPAGDVADEADVRIGLGGRRQSVDAGSSHQSRTVVVSSGRSSRRPSVHLSRQTILNVHAYGDDTRLAAKQAAAEQAAEKEKAAERRRAKKEADDAEADKKRAQLLRLNAASFDLDSMFSLRKPAVFADAAVEDLYIDELQSVVRAFDAWLLAGVTALYMFEMWEHVDRDRWLAVGLTCGAFAASLIAFCLARASKSQSRRRHRRAARIRGLLTAALAFHALAGVLFVCTAIDYHNVGRFWIEWSILLPLAVWMAAHAVFLEYAWVVVALTAVLVAQVVVSVVFKRDVHTWSSTGERLVLVSAMGLLLAYGARVIDRLRRLEFSARQRFRGYETRQETLKQETYNLRDELFAMTLEKFDVGLIGNRPTLDFQCPMERSMAALQELCSDKTLESRHFNTLKDVMGWLSNLNVYSPEIEAQLEGSHDFDIDTDTQRWMMDLVSLRGATKTAHARQRSIGGSSAAGSEWGASDGTTDAPSTESSVSVPLPAHVAAPVDEAAVAVAMQGLDDWGWDVLDIVRVTGGRPAAFVGRELFRRYDLFRRFRLDPDSIMRTFVAVDRAYHDKPYHNAVHAADVTRAVHCFLQALDAYDVPDAEQESAAEAAAAGKAADAGSATVDTSLCKDAGGQRVKLSSLEVLALLFAALAHDMDHPGTNNAFLVNTADDLAITYNDQSVLENHHAAAAFRLLRRAEHRHLQRALRRTGQWEQFRRLVIDFIQLTDLKLHFDFVAKFKNAQMNSTLDWTSDAGKMLVCQMALKCADVGHAAKPLELHKKWTARITQEFYRQGDLERKAGLQVSPFMDRLTQNLPKSQIGFINFLIVPMFSQFVQFVEANRAGRLNELSNPGPARGDKDSGAAASTGADASLSSLLPLMALLEANLAHWKTEAQSCVQTTLDVPK